MNYFWTNTFWFLLLGITTLIEIAYVLAKSKNRKLMVAFYLTVSGMVYMAEVIIFGFLKAYDYFPMIFHQISRLDDGLAGNVFSQFSIAASAVLISVLNLKYYWYIIFALIYAGIEELFLVFGIYKHNWYQTWMTVIGLIIFFSIVKIFYNIFLKRPGRILRYLLISFAVYVPHTLIFTWPFKLLGYPAFNEHILPDPANSVMILFAISFILLSNIIMVTYFRKPKWWWHAMVLLAFYSAYYLAFIFNYIIYKNIGILMLFATVQILAMYLCVLIIDRLYDQLGKRRQLLYIKAPK